MIAGGTELALGSVLGLVIVAAATTAVSSALQPKPKGPAAPPITAEQIKRERSRRLAGASTGGREGAFAQKKNLLGTGGQASQGISVEQPRLLGDA